MYPHIVCNIIHSGQDVETPKCPLIEDWIKKMWYIYTIEYYSAIRKDEILKFVTTWVGLENIMLREISQSEKAKKHDFTHILYIKLKLIDTDNIMVVTREKGGENSKG